MSVVAKRSPISATAKHLFIYILAVIGGPRPITSEYNSVRAVSVHGPTAWTYLAHQHFPLVTRFPLFTFALSSPLGDKWVHIFFQEPSDCARSVFPDWINPGCDEIARTRLICADVFYITTFFCYFCAQFCAIRTLLFGL